MNRSPGTASLSYYLWGEDMAATALIGKIRYRITLVPEDGGTEETKEDGGGERDWDGFARALGYRKADRRERSGVSRQCERKT